MEYYSSYLKKGNYEEFVGLWKKMLDIVLSKIVERRIIYMNRLYKRFF